MRWLWRGREGEPLVDHGIKLNRKLHMPDNGIRMHSGGPATAEINRVQLVFGCVGRSVKQLHCSCAPWFGGILSIIILKLAILQRRVLQVPFNLRFLNLIEAHIFICKSLLSTKSMITNYM